MMRRTWFILTILVTLLLSACGQQTTTPDSAPPVETGVTEEIAETKETVNTTVPESTAGSVEVVSDTTAECRPYSLLDDIFPNVESSLPPLNDDDWVSGPEDAGITILEYSDFL
ncbi:MAG: hypothetical protein MUO76_05900 [Anaerolineaceae bacterium]|nr:hypothetical protein [Anaerolineaceae bacterium]